MCWLGYPSKLRNNVRSRAWGAGIGCSYRVERCCIVKVTLLACTFVFPHTSSQYSQNISGLFFKLQRWLNDFLTMLSESVVTVATSLQLVQFGTTWHSQVYWRGHIFVKKKLNSGLICTLYVPTTSQLAHVLAKVLSNHTF